MATLTINNSLCGSLITTTTTVAATTTTTGIPNISLLVAGTEYNNVRTLYTEDGSTWVKPSVGYATNQVRALRNANGVWLMGGYLPDGSWNDQDTMMYSYDGVNWTGMGLGVLGNQVNDITYGDGVWVAVGDNSVSQKIAYSTVAQPISWSDWSLASFSGFSGTYGGYGVAYGNGRFLAFGDPGTNSIAYSDDGVSWIGVTGDTSVFDYFGTSAAFDGVSRWVATGADNNALAYSDDNGLSWTAAGGGIFGSGTATGAYDVAYGNSTWVAVGEGTNSIAYSSDGISWTGIGVTYLGEGYSVEFIDGYFYAGGTSGSGGASTLYRSTDGITWSALLSSSPYPKILGIGSYLGNTTTTTTT